MRILVTGGAGYIGSTLVPLLLDKGHSVRVIDSMMYGAQSLLGSWANPAFEFMRADIRNKDAVSRAVKGVDAVVHLAAIVGDPACSRHPDVARAVNLEASLNLLDESKRAGVSRFLFSSTCSNYGKMKDSTRYVDENSELSPVSLYAETKVSVEKAILDPSRTGDLCATSMRFATVFGVSPRMRFDLTVNEFVAEIMMNKHLVVFGEQFWRPYAHARDIARAIAVLLDAPKEKVRNEVFNIGSTKENYTKQMLVELIQPLVPGSKVEFVKKSEDPRDYRVSFEKFSKTFGYEITRTVPQAIEEVADLFRHGVIENFKDQRYKN